MQASCNGLASKMAENSMSRVFSKKMKIFSPNYAPCGRFFKNDLSDARFTISMRGPRLSASSCRRRTRLRTVCWLTWRILAVIAVEKNSPGGSLRTRVCGRTGGKRINLPNTELMRKSSTLTAQRFHGRCRRCNLPQNTARFTVVTLQEKRAPISFGVNVFCLGNSIFCLDLRNLPNGMRRCRSYGDAELAASMSV